jgi:magnesium chelatase accessory protein
LDWPDQVHSESCEFDGIRWHIQRQGTGPTVLLLHGTGGSTHSWAAVTGPLARHFHVVAIDLPGHGFTHVPATVERERSPFPIAAMAARLSALLAHLGERPQVAAGHSAGAAILLRMTLDGGIAPERLLGVCPALVAPPAWYVTLVAPLLGAFVEQPFVAASAAQLALATRLVQRVLASTGSTLPPAALERYRRLCAQPEHVHAALAMMARWDLPGLQRDWHALRTPLHLIAAQGDQWIPRDALERAVQGIPGMTWQVEEGGHLLPEERPEVVVAAIQRAARQLQK